MNLKRNQKMANHKKKILKMRGSIKPGEVRNPKGSPYIRDLVKTGSKTTIGRFWQNLKNYRDDTTSQIVKKIRRCDKCPLAPFVQPDGTEVMRCPHWKRDSKTCIIPARDFFIQCKVLREAQKVGSKKLAELNAIKTMMYGELAFQKDMVMEGAPGDNTAQFQKLAGEQTHNLLKVEVGEKQNIEQQSSVSTLDINKLIKEHRHDLLDDEGDYKFGEEE